MKSISTTFLTRKEAQTEESGINMVDLMMWLVIAALLLAAAIQGIGYYQQNAYVYQMKSVVDVATSRVTALASDSGAITIDEVDSVVADLNATYGPNIVLTASAIDVTAAGAPDASPYGFELASSVTSTTVGPGQTYYIRASHTAVSGYDVIHTFGDTASKKSGTYMVNKGTTTTAGPGGASSSTPTATATPTPTATTAPVAMPTGADSYQRGPLGHYEPGVTQTQGIFMKGPGMPWNDTFDLYVKYTGSAYPNGNIQTEDAILYCQDRTTLAIYPEFHQFTFPIYNGTGGNPYTTERKISCNNWQMQAVGAIAGSLGAGHGLEAYTNQSGGTEDVGFYGQYDKSLK